MFATVLLLVALAPLVHKNAPRWWASIPGIALLAAALLRPSLLAPLYRVWFQFGLLLHRIISPVVLGIMFFIVITPIGILMRTFGKDPLHLRHRSEVTSYWIPRIPPGPPPDTLRDQF